LAYARQWQFYGALSKLEFFFLVGRVLCKNTCLRVQPVFRSPGELGCGLFVQLGSHQAPVVPAGCSCSPQPLLRCAPSHPHNPQPSNECGLAARVAASRRWQVHQERISCLLGWVYFRPRIQRVGLWTTGRTKLQSCVEL